MTTPSADPLPASRLPGRSLRVPARGLEHHVLEWDAAPSARLATPTVLLIHGFMDAAVTWDLVAPELADAGLRVLAPDLRGFGDGARVPPGGYYFFPDYVFDMADLVEQLVPAGSPLFVVGHSMGGSVATMFAGTYPERVARLAVLEGAGPPDNQFAVSPDRMRQWIDDVRVVARRAPRRMPSREDALRRLANNHPRVAEPILQTRLDALARPLPDGGFAWKADPLHTTRSPLPFYAETWKAFAHRVRGPVLFISGGPTGWHPDGEDDRVGAFAGVEKAEIADAGHMMHWTEPAKLTRLLIRFLADDVITGASTP